MKKLIIAVTAMIFTTGAFAQSDSANKKMNPVDVNTSEEIKQNKMQMHPDGYMMQDGKMMVIKDGKMMVMESDVTLTNGTFLMRDGNYVSRQGTKTMMKEGQHMDFAGKMVPMKPVTPTKE